MLKKPTLGLRGQAEWWHHHGNKMGIVEFEPKVYLLVLEGSAAKLKITGTNDHEEKPQWHLEWSIRHAGASVKGEVRFDDHELASAFGLNADFGDDFVLERFGGDSAKQGRYIRWGEYLNIPGPGTGYDGDPNISIELTDGMRDVIKKLLG